ncbi:hypothetical protein ACOMHN_024435 [Nucella lapillus]
MHIGTVFFNKYFEEKGFIVVSAQLETDSNDGLFNGVRSYRLIGNKKQWHDLPHVVNFLDYGFQALVKVTGREPLCLRCRKFGHQRAQCNQMRGGLLVCRQEESRIQQQNQNEQKPPPRRWESPVLTSLKPPVSGPSKEAERRSLSSSEDEVMESVEGDVSNRVTTEDQPQPGPMEAEKAVVGDSVPKDTDSQDIPWGPRATTGSAIENFSWFWPYPATCHLLSSCLCLL